MYSKLLSALLAFTLVCTTLITSAFAWVQMATVNVLDGVEFQAAFNDDLYLSLDGINFHKTITNQQLMDVVGSPKLTHVTTEDGINFHSGPLSRTRPLRVNKDFMMFEIWFRYETQASDEEALTSIYLSDRNHVTYGNHQGASGTFATSKGNQFTTSVTYNNGHEIVLAGETHTYYAKDALRISAYDPHESRSFIYDISENPDRGYGKSYGAYDYYKQVTGEKLEIPEEKPQTIYGLTQFDPQDPYQALDDLSRIVTLQKVTHSGSLTRYEGRATISLWIEGWDADTFDAIFGDTLTIQLAFRAAKRFTT